MFSFLMVGLRLAQICVNEAASPETNEACFVEAAESRPNIYKCHLISDQTFRRHEFFGCQGTGSVAEPHHSHFLTLCWPWKDKVATLEPILWKMVRKFTPRRSNLKSLSQFLLYSGNLVWNCQFLFYSLLQISVFIIWTPWLLVLFKQCHFFSVVLKERPLLMGFDLSVPPWFLLKVLLQCSG